MSDVSRYWIIDRSRSYGKVFNDSLRDLGGSMHNRRQSSGSARGQRERETLRRTYPSSYSRVPPV